MKDKIMKRRVWVAAISVAVSTASLACSGAPQASDPSADASLKQLMAQRATLQKQLGASEADFTSQCEVTAGDCLILARERRSELVPQGAFPQCESDTTQRTRCENDILIQQGKTQALIDYYEYENWCSDKLLQCTLKMAEDAQLAARRARADERRKAIEAASDALGLQVGVDVARAKVDYLRSTLPADGDTLCAGLAEVPQCREATQAMIAKYEVELQKEPDSYDERAAASLYEQAKKAEASCYEPEYTCIFDKLGQYGATKQSHKWLDKNVAVLGQRQALLRKVPADVGEQCLTEGATKHQARVIDTYKKYVRRPILYFRVQLHMAFLAVHQAQVSCLTGKAK